MGLIYVASATAVSLGLWRRERYRAFWEIEILLPAAVLAIFPTVLLWWLLR